MSPHCPKNSIFVLAFKTHHKLVSIPFQPRVQQAYPFSASVTSSNCHFSCVRLFVTLWTVAGQGPLSVGFSREEYWVGCHALLQGIFSTLGLNLCLLHLLHRQAGSLPLVPPGKPMLWCVLFLLPEMLLPLVFFLANWSPKVQLRYHLLYEVLPLPKPSLSS